MRLAASRRNSPLTNGNSSSAVPGNGGGDEGGTFGSEFIFASLEWVQAMSSVRCRTPALPASRVIHNLPPLRFGGALWKAMNNVWIGIGNLF